MSILPSVDVPCSLSMALTGSGGAGVLTAGQTLMEAAALHGWSAMMGRSLGPQIRGGESAALLRLSAEPVQSPDDFYDLLIAVDWGNIERFASELPLHGETVLVADPASGAVPAFMLEQQPQVVEIPLKALAQSIAGGRVNMVATGVAAACAGLPLDEMETILRRQLADKGEEAIASSLAAVQAGAAAVEAARASCPALSALPRLAAPSGAEPSRAEAGRWSISGNEAAALGVLRAGVRFSAAYPITPATEILEWLAPALTAQGGTLVQAEDELASVAMCLGASFGGVPAVTATSGPGLSLMVEGLGLAVASETPVTVINVMRGGPSTGIPTKSEQSDLNAALYGLHGDAPHVVTAPTSVADCAATAQWTVCLAEALQTVAIMLSDQAAGQTRAILPPLAALPIVAERKLWDGQGDYVRYQPEVADGVSAMSLPGMAGGTYTADGLEHAPKGTPSTQGKHHAEQLDKRLRKLMAYDYGDRWAEVTGEGNETLAIITFGSLSMQAREARQRLLAAGVPVRVVSLRLLAPALPERLTAALAGIERLLIVEQNHTGQFATYLRGHYTLPSHVSQLHRPGPLAIRPQEIVRAVVALQG